MKCSGTDDPFIKWWHQAPAILGSGRNSDSRAATGDIFFPLKNRKTCTSTQGPCGREAAARATRRKSCCCKSCFLCLLFGVSDKCWLNYDGSAKKEAVRPAAVRCVLTGQPDLRCATCQIHVSTKKSGEIRKRRAGPSSRNSSFSPLFFFQEIGIISIYANETVAPTGISPSITKFLGLKIVRFQESLIAVAWVETRRVHSRLFFFSNFPPNFLVLFQKEQATETKYAGCRGQVDTSRGHHTPEIVVWTWEKGGQKQQQTKRMESRQTDGPSFCRSTPLFSLKIFQIKFKVFFFRIKFTTLE